MNVKMRGEITPLVGCTQTAIEDDFLEALIVNKRGLQKYAYINPITCNGFGRHFPAKQVLSFLMRKSFGLVRRPGTYDIKLESKHFESISNDEINGAIKDIQRIYDHTQKEMAKFVTAVELVRGIDGVEASVCARLLDDLGDGDVSYYFQTITFFNHLYGAYNRDMKVTINCPIDWIWASAYTLKDLAIQKTDEEFIVVCNSDDGTMQIPRANFVVTSDITHIDRVCNTNYYNTKHCPKYLHQSISALMTEGFEPDDFERTIAQYREGTWERRMRKMGHWLDEKFGGYNKNAVILKAKKSS